MYDRKGSLPTPLNTARELDDLDVLASSGDVHETPFNVFIGHNLGHRVFAMSVPFRQFYELSDVANDREAGPVAQRPLDLNHAKKLATYMLKGLVSAAKLRRIAQSKEVPGAFDKIAEKLGDQPYFSLQPIVCNVRDVPPGGSGPQGIRGVRLETNNHETACFRVFLAERHILWVIDGQHRRKGADLTMQFLDQVRQIGKYPAKSPTLYPESGAEVTVEEMLVWNEAYEAARAYSTITVEVHLGLTPEQEKQLFHDLNNLGKRVDRSLALQFDSSNPVTRFIKNEIVANLGIHITEREPKNWADDDGSLVLKDVVAVNAIAFLNKGNISGATPALIEPREETVSRLWAAISEIQSFGEHRAREKTVAAQPVLLKALAKLTFDFKFSARRPDNGDELFETLASSIPNIDFTHENPIWQFYNLSEDEAEQKFPGLKEYLPSNEGANRDIGSLQDGYIRFGAKHNDIFPILGDMIRWQLRLPNRHG